MPLLPFVLRGNNLPRLICQGLDFLFGYRKKAKKMGAGDRQRARHRAERWHWRRWSNAFEHWQESGQVVNPETGEKLECQGIPGKRTTRRNLKG